MGHHTLARICFEMPSPMGDVLAGTGTLAPADLTAFMAHVQQAAEVYQDVVAGPPQGMTAEQALRALARIPSHRLTADLTRDERDRLLHTAHRSASITAGERNLTETSTQLRNPADTENPPAGQVTPQPAVTHMPGRASDEVTPKRLVRGAVDATHGRQALNLSQVKDLAVQARVSALHLLPNRSDGRPANTEQWCVTVAEAVRNKVFGSTHGLPGTSGLRPSRTVDDAAVLNVAAQRLAPGALWTPVGDWDVVHAALADKKLGLGQGSMAIVMTRTPVGSVLVGGRLSPGREGHVWVAYYPRYDTEDHGPIWIEIAPSEHAFGADKAAPGVRLLNKTPGVPPLQAQAVVIDPAGRVTPHALTPFRASESIAHALVDPAVNLHYGAIGWEVEDRHILAYQGPRLNKGTVLVRGNGVEIQVDSHPFQRIHDGRLFGSLATALSQTPYGAPKPTVESYQIPEVVSVPHRTLPGEQRPEIANGIAFTERARALLSFPDFNRAHGPIALTSLFLESEGWTVTQYGRGVSVTPAVDAEGGLAYAQYTAGVPLDGGNGFLDFIENNLNEGWKKSFAIAGREFGKLTAARYASELARRPVTVENVTALMTVPGISQTWFYSRLLFVHALANPLRNRFFPNSLVKNMLWIASRTPFADIYSNLLPETQAFFSRNHDSIIRDLDSTLRNSLDRYARNHGVPTGDLTRLLHDETWSGLPIREFITAALRGGTSAGNQVSQNEIVGVDDYFNLDTNDGRLAVGLVLLEAREFRNSDAPPQRIRQDLASMASETQSAYARASLIKSAPFAAGPAIERIVTNGPINQLIPVFDKLTQSGAPSYLAAATRDRIIESLGAHALGAEFPSWAISEMESAIGRLNSHLSHPKNRRDPLSSYMLTGLATSGANALASLRNMGTQSAPPPQSSAGGQQISTAGSSRQHSRTYSDHGQSRPAGAPATERSVRMAFTQTDATDALNQQILQGRLSELTPGTAEHARVQEVLRTYDAPSESEIARNSSSAYIGIAHTENAETNALNQHLLQRKLDQLPEGDPQRTRIQNVLATYRPGPAHPPTHPPTHTHTHTEATSSQTATQPQESPDVTSLQEPVTGGEGPVAYLDAPKGHTNTPRRESRADASSGAQEAFGAQQEASEEPGSLPDRVGQLQQALRQEVRPAVRAWDKTEQENLATLRANLDTAGSRALVFVGTTLNDVVWAINIGGNIVWLDQHYNPIQVPQSPIGSIDINYQGQLTGEAAHNLRHANSRAVTFAKTGFCDLNPGVDVHAVLS